MRTPRATAQLPEVLARLDQRLADVVEVAEVALVHGHARAADRVYLVGAVRFGGVVDEEVGHGRSVSCPWWFRASLFRGVAITPNDAPNNPGTRRGSQAYCGRGNRAAGAGARVDMSRCDRIRSAVSGAPAPAPSGPDSTA